MNEKKIREQIDSLKDGKGCGKVVGEWQRKPRYCNQEIFSPMGHWVKYLCPDCVDKRNALEAEIAVLTDSEVEAQD